MTLEMTCPDGSDSEGINLGDTGLHAPLSMAAYSPSSSGLPDAEAPTVAIAPIGTVDEGATQSLTATLTGGVYDGLAYLWEVVSGGGTISNADQRQCYL